MGPLLFCALCGCAAAPATPPFNADESCTATEYRALDFWLGDWEVRNPKGGVEGTNRIVADLSGCSIRESWTARGGGRGESTFFFDRAARQWKQVWITDQGSWKEKAQAEAPPDALRFQGELPRPAGGTVLDRTTLTRLPDGRVRQVIEQSPDGGKTWPASWEGLYSRPAAAPACAAAEFHQLDFWLGDWDVRIRGRAQDGEKWEEGHGTNRIQRILGGCAVLENFEADGPGQLWAGKSISQYLPAEKRWRQVWVDDQGSWLPFTGGRSSDQFVLTGEPKAGKTMRMIFHDIRPDHISWRWEGTRDGGKTWTPQLLIEYRRPAPPGR
jgi:hypothetical protein